jgi:transcriptional regulator with XRE-family HTH domain
VLRGDARAELKALGEPEGLRANCGHNISRWRLRRGWSPRELADALQVGTWTATSVAAIERGDSGGKARGLTLGTLEAFAQALTVAGSMVTPADLARVPRQPALRPVG